MKAYYEVKGTKTYSGDIHRTYSTEIEALAACERLKQSGVSDIKMITIIEREDS